MSAATRALATGRMVAGMFPELPPASRLTARFAALGVPLASTRWPRTWRGRLAMLERVSVFVTLPPDLAARLASLRRQRTKAGRRMRRANVRRAHTTTARIRGAS